jgi:hypothetical protein
MQAIALRFAPERMEVEARDVQIKQRRRVIECVESPKRPALDFRRNFSASALAEQFLQPLVAEASYHLT